MATATRQVLSISLPREMICEMKQVGVFEHRTNSELVRQALREYINAHKRQIPSARATASELRAIKSADKEIARGEYVSLDSILKWSGR